MASGEFGFLKDEYSLTSSAARMRIVKNQDNRVEISAASLKFTYMRFLADAASGMLVLLLGLCAYHVRSIRALAGDIFVQPVGHEMKIIILSLGVVLSIPLGLVLNATGWFLFGQIQVKLAGEWLRTPPAFLARSTLAGYPAEALISFFGLTQNNLVPKAVLYEKLLSLFRPQELAELEHIQGLKRFVRSSAVIFCGASLATSVLAVFGCGAWFISCSVLFFLLSAMSLLLLSLLEYYQSLSVLNHVFISCLPKTIDCLLPPTGIELSEIECRVIEQISSSR